MTATTGRTALAIVAILTLLLSLFAMARPVLADHTTPLLLGEGDKECQDLGYDYGYKYDAEPPEGTHNYATADGSFTVTMTKSGRSVSFSNASVGVGAFAVKGGSEASGGGTTVQHYDPPQTSSNGSVTPPGTQAGISHVTFCFDFGKIIVEKQTNPDGSTQQFEFDTSYDASNFFLTDGQTNDSGDLRATTHTVSEVNLPDGWTLTDITCTESEIANTTDDGTTATVKLDSGETVTCVFTNSQELASLIVLKTDDLGDPLAGAEFSIVDADNQSAGANQTTTLPSGRVCFDNLEVGDTYTVTEVNEPGGHFPADPDFQTEVAVEGTCTQRATAAADITFANNRIGSLIVLKTDDETPANPLADAEFSIVDADNLSAGANETTTLPSGTVCFDNLIAGDAYTVTEVDEPDGYMPANPASQTEDAVEGTCTERATAAADITFTNALIVDELGSITINKVTGCEACATLTRGYWFNAAGVHDDEANALIASLFEEGEDAFLVDIAGMEDPYEVSDADDVRDFTHSDPKIEQLFVQYMTTLLNVAVNGDDCLLLTREFDGMSVAEWLAAAERLLAGEPDEGDPTVSETIDALTAINESNDDFEGDEDDRGVTLDCPEGTSGPLAGVTFELWMETNETEGLQTDGANPDDEHEDSPFGPTDASGQLVIGNLEAGIYYLVEIDAPEGCTFDDTPIEVVIPESDDNLETDEMDVTVNVTNDCEGPPPPPPPTAQVFGSITIIKDAAPNNAQDFAFTTTGTGLSSFSLDDDADATLSNSRTFSGLGAGSYTVIEGPAAGWTLTSITCSTTAGTGNTTTRTASITLAAGANVTCTFLNTQVTGGTLPGGGGPPATTPPATTAPTPREGTLADTAMLPEPTGSIPAALLGLMMLGGALAATGYAMAAEARRRR